MNARIYNPCLDKYIDFNYNKVVEIDNQGVNYDAIKKFKEEIKQFEQEHKETNGKGTSGEL